MNRDLLLELLTKKLIGEQELSEAENDTLEKALRDPELEEILGANPSDHQLRASIGRLEAMNASRMDQKMADLRARRNRTSIRTLKPYLVAASILLIVGFIGLQVYIKKSPVQQTTVVAIVQPAVNKARLRLSSGTTVILDSSRDGQIADEGGTAVQKSGSRLIYSARAPRINSPGRSNTLSVPRGALFEVTLNDQTHVWLNSESDLTYPAQFGSERRVKLVGEAYFEVAKDSKRPFILETPHGTVQVLGTSFNVNAYPDENIERTTLLEGSIRVSDGKTALVLQPGGQALQKAGLMSLEHPSVSNVTAWRRGFFVLQDADIQSIMEQIGRFYDVTVAFRDKSRLSTQTYYGTIPRNQTLQETLKALELLKIKTTLSNRTIIVEPE